MVSRFDIWLVALDPVIGSEIAKTRPCVILSPDEMNRYLNTVIAAPMTRTCKQWPTRQPIVFAEKEGEIALDQLRTLSKKRLIRKLGHLPEHFQDPLLARLREMFS
ncbi:type II toxin-antitoxin system PemK/MazF family toxin [Sulfurivirga sp.]|uniref:type II toxin-antitoxin system PemK/MazF family toxin n=1 Tax=Sulfurivirga sp. TaxID=2614236 RepID=UPI0025FCA115|nr:type II toxin-antitoxin system PemK/MazF family toxin [Sulfurivirga sp.]